MSEKTAWQKYKESLGETRPWDLVNPNINKLNKEISEKRLEICKSCPEFLKITTQCKKCGCVMKFKTTLPLAECPIGKWHKEEA